MRYGCHINWSKERSAMLQMIIQTIKKMKIITALFILPIIFVSGCSSNYAANSKETALFTSHDAEARTSNTPMLMASAAMPQASGVTVLSGNNTVIDASNTQEGYVMVKYTGSPGAKCKAVVVGPSGLKYTYNLNNGSFDTFPLSDGDGSYTIGVYLNAGGNKYSTVYSTGVNVVLKNQFVPFLLPNQYVNYKPESQVVKTAVTLTKDTSDELEKIKAIYTYVVNGFTYDVNRAATVQSGYLPELDSVLAAKKGICFDYAAVMTAMLRSQNIPTKMVVGYTGDLYHAWISTYTSKSGWIEGVIFFDGQTWKLMDPTFASSSNSSTKIMNYIGDSSNYQAKYLY